MIITCDDCNETRACFWDTAPPKTARADEFYCEKCVVEVEKGFTRYRFEQRKTSTEEPGKYVDLPYFYIDGEWVPWPLNR